MKAVPKRQIRRTVNFGPNVYALIEHEARHVVLGEQLDIAVMARVLVREAVNARRKKRGESQVPTKDYPVPIQR